jgi:hypothetical protein
VTDESSKTPLRAFLEASMLSTDTEEKKDEGPVRHVVETISYELTYRVEGYDVDCACCQGLGVASDLHPGWWVLLHVDVCRGCMEFADNCSRAGNISFISVYRGV